MTILIVTVKSLQIKAKNLLAVVSYCYLMWLLERSVILQSVQSNVHSQKHARLSAVGVFLSQNIRPRISLESVSCKRKIFFASKCGNLMRAVPQVSSQPGGTQTIPLIFYTGARNRGDDDMGLMYYYCRGCEQPGLLAGKQECASGHLRFVSRTAEEFTDLLMQRKRGETKSLQICCWLIGIRNCKEFGLEYAILQLMMFRTRGAKMQTVVLLKRDLNKLCWEVRSPGMRFCVCGCQFLTEVPFGQLMGLE